MAKRVMIVEDNELNMKLFKDLIEASGYETIRTRNGLEALDLEGAAITDDGGDPPIPGHQRSEHGGVDAQSAIPLPQSSTGTMRCSMM